MSVGYWLAFTFGRIRGAVHAKLWFHFLDYAWYVNERKGESHIWRITCKNCRRNLFLDQWTATTIEAEVAVAKNKIASQILTDEVEKR